MSRMLEKLKAYYERYWEWAGEPVTVYRGTLYVELPLALAVLAFS